MDKRIRILIVDDHALFRKGLIELFQDHSDIEIVGEACDGPTAVQMCHTKRPTVLLMDVHMPGGGGVEAVRKLKKSPDTQVLMLTISDKDQDLLGALKAGADGYLLKSAEPEELVRAIRQVVAGKGILSPEVTARVMRAAAEEQQRLANPLSARERDVLNRLARGATTAAIAADLVISENTVKTHIRRILRKLDAANRTEAVAIAAEMGLISSN